MRNVLLLVAALTCAQAASAQLINGSVIVDEIDYNNDVTMTPTDWFEIYNTAATSVNIGGWEVHILSNPAVFTFPNGYMLSGHEHLALVHNDSSFHAFFPNVTNYLGPLPFSLGNAMDEIKLYDANEILQYRMRYYGDTLHWPKGAHGYGRTLELTSTTAPPDSASSWFDGCMFGSPGAAYSPCDPPIVFSEINYSSDPFYNTGDWVELHNRTNAAINLTGWHLRDSQDSMPFIIPNWSLPANGYLVICADTTLFDHYNTTVANRVGNMAFGFSSSGEVIRLYNAQDKLQFSVVYNNKLPWDTLAHGHGYTLELLDPTGHMDDGNNWFHGCFLGSPGVAYHTCNSSVPMVSADDAHISLVSDNVYNFIINSAQRMRLYDAQGKLLRDALVNDGSHDVDLRGLPAGVYVMQLYNAAGSRAYKLLRD